MAQPTFHIGVLVLLSLVLTAATLFPSLTGGQLTALVAGAAGAGLVGTAAVTRWRARQAGLPDDPEEELDTGVVLEAERLTWRMPPLSELPRPRWSPGRRLGMLALRGYLVIAVGLVVVKIVELSAAH